MGNSPAVDTSATKPSSVARRHIPLALVLIGSITLLIVVSVGSVLYISLREATENTFSLLADKANANLDLLQVQIGSKLGPVEAAATELAERIGHGSYTVGEGDSELHHLLRGALAALPHATAVIFVSSDAHAVRIARFDGRVGPVPENPVLRERQEFGLRRAASLDKPSWVEPQWMPLLGEPVLSFIAPVKRNGAFYGALVISTRLGELADFLASIEAKSGVRAFVLYDNRYVLSHPDLLKHGKNISATAGEVALPTIAVFEDEAFRLLRKDARRATRIMETADVDDAPFDDEYLLLIREIAEYGPAPWQIGLRFRQSDVFTDIERLRVAALTGLTILLAAVAIGYLLARTLNRQIGRFAATADRLRNLDIANVQPLPDSPIRELSNAANAFNALISAMRWFETYVPKTLVLRLMKTGSAGAALSEERVLTILFSDIRGFSTLVEHMDPVETAGLLNRHFALLATCIEAEGGTVDKFMGDSIMAFWGAPEDQVDHAARALRSAVAMKAAIISDNARHLATGQPVVAIRLGIHTRPVVVGNIGSHNRVNYTVIGDTVNVAARLEAFAKDLALDEDCVALVSGATLRAAGDAAPAGEVIEHLGDVPVRGRDGKVEVYRLTG